MKKIIFLTKNSALTASIAILVLISTASAAFCEPDTSFASKNEYNFSQRKQKPPVNLYSPVSGAVSQPAYNHGSVSVPTSPPQYAEPIYFQTMPAAQYGAKFNFSPFGNSGISVGGPNHQDNAVYTDILPKNNSNAQVPSDNSDFEEGKNPYETPNVPPLYQNY